MIFVNFLENCSKLFITLLSFALILLLGVIDFFTGFEISFSVFYLIPVAIGVWFGSKQSAIVISIISAVTWHLANYLAGEHFSHPLIPMWNALTRLGFFLVVVLLITKLKSSLVHESELARKDFLTGAANPRAFYELAQIEISRLKRYKHPFSVAYFDADNFKSVNDKLGHHTGSRLLVKTVEVMNRNLRATDVVARIGGDEFAVLLPETGKDQAVAVMHKLREKLAAEMQSNGWFVTFSVGLLTCIDPPHTVDEMIKIADGLMYEVKKSGRNDIKHKVLKEPYVNKDSTAGAGLEIMDVS